MYIEDIQSDDVCIKFKGQKHFVVRAWSNKNINVKESKSVQKDLVTRMPDVRYNVHQGHAK